MIELPAARETFEASADFTVGIEEEFALLDPETLLLVPTVKSADASKVSRAAGSSIMPVLREVYVR